MLAIVTPLLTTKHASATTPQAVIGMPFTGQWAYNKHVDPPYTDSNSSHPSVHHTPGGGNWATDIYAAEGQAVKLDVTYATGALSFSWYSGSTSCGQSTRLYVIVDGTTVGWLYFAHLNNAVTSGTITNGMTLGTMHDWGSSCNPGLHTHIEFHNSSNYSCYADNGYPGTLLSYGTNFGVLGSSNTGAQQACSSIPSGRLTQMSNSGSGWSTSDISNGYSTQGTPWTLWGSGVLDVFVIDAGGGLDQFHVNLSTGTWTVYPGLTGSNLSGGLSGVMNGTTLNLFAANTDGNLVQMVKPSGGSWTTSVITGATIAGRPAVLWGSSSVSVFADATDGSLKQYYTVIGSGTWTVYTISNYSGLAGGVEVYQYGSNTEVFSNNASKHLIQMVANGSWSSPSDLTTSASATANSVYTPGLLWGSSTVDLFPEEPTGALQQYHVTLGSGGWHNYQDIVTSLNLVGGTDASLWGSTAEVFAVNQQ
jgi:hypothetical protein